MSKKTQYDEKPEMILHDFIQYAVARELFADILAVCSGIVTAVSDNAVEEYENHIWDHSLEDEILDLAEELENYKERCVPPSGWSAYKRIFKNHPVSVAKIYGLPDMIRGILFDDIHLDDLKDIYSILTSISENVFYLEDGYTGKLETDFLLKGSISLNLSQKGEQS